MYKGKNILTKNFLQKSQMKDLSTMEQENFSAFQLLNFLSVQNSDGLSF